MSSRAVRRALRNQEAQLAVQPPSPSSSPEPEVVKKELSPFAALTGDDGSVQEPDQEEEEEDETVNSSKPSLFAVLAAADDESPVEDEDQREPEPEPVQESKMNGNRFKKKKKQAKKKKKQADVKKDQVETDKNGMDEIDKALAELDLKAEISGTSKHEVHLQSTVSVQEAQADARLLSVDTKNFDPEREMRRLFSRRVFQEEQREIRRVGGAGRRGLARPMASKRNVLVQPGEDWPPLIGTSAMSMEVVDTNGEITSFKYTHSKPYMYVQANFHMSLRVDDSEYLVELFRENPYHVSVNLQMAEILLHQGDNTQAAKCIEYALYTLNKSFHPLFNISSGRVRLPFKYYENRLFYLAVYRHVRNLERKGTWHSAFEFMKLLLEISAEDDPYCVLLMIDIYALHSQNDQFIIDLASSHMFSDRVPDLPNVAFSLALAYFHKKDVDTANKCIDVAVSSFPWTLSALAFALGLTVPVQLMQFNEPPSAVQQILTQLYIACAQPLWSTPTTKTFLDAAIARTKTSPPQPQARVLDPKKPVSRDLVRHVLLTDIKPALEYLPRESIQNEEIWVDDMLPPLDNVSPYQDSFHTSSAGQHGQNNNNNDTTGMFGRLSNRIAQWRQRRNQTNTGEN
ncbi:transcriptional repressor TCF25-domain-containing protein, partial [Lipomyces arxii]|uniref:transcriptional repressor TCF25-domain-containing protein n=1 Tax=Lipomyces arxii TaxID=56418 RepID=UPI0034CF0EF8